MIMDERPRGMRIVDELVSIRNGLGRLQELRIIETGSIRAADEDHAIADGHSTLYIAQWVYGQRLHGANAAFISIDLDTKPAEAYLRVQGLRDFVTFMQGNSVEMLPTVMEDIWSRKEVHLAYLDSTNDPLHILEEFKLLAPHMHELGVIMVDDVAGELCTLKGEHVIAYAMQNGWAVTVEGAQAIMWRA